MASSRGAAWSEEEAKLLGTGPDSLVADEITRNATAGVSGYQPRTAAAASAERARRGIKSYAASKWGEGSEVSRDLCRLTADEMLEKHDVSHGSYFYQRRKRGIRTNAKHKAR